MKKDEFYQYALDSYRPAESLIKMVPADKLDWQPGPSFMTLGQVICHLSDGIGDTLNTMIAGSWPKPEEMEDSMKQDKMPRSSGGMGSTIPWAIKFP